MFRRTIDRVEVSAYTVPTVSPEADGTFAWDQTTIVVVEAEAGGVHGLGYTYADIATAHLIDHALKKEVAGKDPMAVAECWVTMVQKIRNLGRPGICSMRSRCWMTAAAEWRAASDSKQISMTSR